MEGGLHAVWLVHPNPVGWPYPLSPCLSAYVCPLIKHCSVLSKTSISNFIRMTLKKCLYMHDIKWNAITVKHRDPAPFHSSQRPASGYSQAPSLWLWAEDFQFSSTSGKWVAVAGYGCQLDRFLEKSYWLLTVSRALSEVEWWVSYQLGPPHGEFRVHHAE